MKRGKYLKYLCNEQIKIPKSTQSYHRKKARTDQQLISSHLKQQLYIEKTNEVQDNSKSLAIIIQNKILPEKISLNSIHDFHNTTSSNDVVTDFFEMDFSFEHTKEDLSAAALTFYFSGKMTQEHFSKALKFFNLTSNIKIPTTFGSLKNIITSDNGSIRFDKRNFYQNCNKLVTLKSQYQRACDTCQYK